MGDYSCNHYVMPANTFVHHDVIRAQAGIRGQMDQTCTLGQKCIPDDVMEKPVLELPIKKAARKRLFL